MVRVDVDVDDDADADGILLGSPAGAGAAVLEGLSKAWRSTGVNRVWNIFAKVEGEREACEHLVV